jgi:uncharacterized protein YbbK (DUF523 family)
VIESCGESIVYSFDATGTCTRRVGTKVVFCPENLGGLPFPRDWI